MSFRTENVQSYSRPYPPPPPLSLLAFPTPIPRPYWRIGSFSSFHSFIEFYLSPSTSFSLSHFSRLSCQQRGELWPIVNPDSNGDTLDVSPLSMACECVRLDRRQFSRNIAAEASSRVSVEIWERGA